ncbi:MAG: biotin-dependent carboxyltransferase family protein [Devosia sp.]|nr:biotin-dependent carboxyltransferase family protein [Devosia sp.]
MISILECGKLNTIQDLGRFGLRSIGITTSGAMDSVALRVGNILVGNGADFAAIEIQTYPFTLRFETETRFALTGTDAPADLDGMPLPPWWSMSAKPGQTLRIGQPRTGARSYIAVAGGIGVPLTLGSRSTSLRNGFGGLEGRALRAGDRLTTTTLPYSSVEIGANIPSGLAAAQGTLDVRVIPGAELDILPTELQRQFWTAVWLVTAQSDRGGYRLRGPELKLPAPMEMRSYGVVAGIIQLPPSGQPIVQLSDANTAGGYPRMGGVIEADLHQLGQAQPGSKVRFRQTDFETAQAAQRDIEDFLSELRQACAEAVAATTNQEQAGA